MKTIGSNLFWPAPTVGVLEELGVSVMKDSLESLRLFNGRPTLSGSGLDTRSMISTGITTSDISVGFCIISLNVNRNDVVS